MSSTWRFPLEVLAHWVAAHGPTDLQAELRQIRRLESDLPVRLPERPFPLFDATPPPFSADVQAPSSPQGTKGRCRGQTVGSARCGYQIRCRFRAFEASGRCRSPDGPANGNPESRFLDLSPLKSDWGVQQNPVRLWRRGRIRTLGARKGTPDFESGPFDQLRHLSERYGMPGVSQLRSLAAAVKFSSTSAPESIGQKDVNALMA